MVKGNRIRVYKDLSVIIIHSKTKGKERESF